MYKFKKEKAMAIISSTLALSLAGCDCSKFIKSTSDRNMKESDNVSVTDITNEPQTTIPINSESKSITQSESELQTVSDPTEHIDNVGDVKIIDHKAPTNDELLEFKAISSYYFVALGMDNPYLLNDACNYFNDPTATIEEFNYLQPENMNECENFGTVYDCLCDMTNHYDFDLIRYILSEKDLRFMIDEIPYSFFEEYFPDYLMYYDIGSSPGEHIPNENPLVLEYRQGMDGNDYSSFLSSILQEDSDESKEAMRYFIFNYLKNYNVNRYYIATLNSDLIGFIPIARSVDGRNVLAPTRFRYSQLQSEVNKFPRCENIDISTPETYEDLVNSGVDVELMEEVFHYSGIDIPSLSQGDDSETDDQQRTRGTSTP